MHSEAMHCAWACGLYNARLGSAYRAAERTRCGAPCPWVESCVMAVQGHGHSSTNDTGLPAQWVHTRLVCTIRGLGGGGGGWHKASVSDCWPLAAPITLSPPLILTLCGPERVLVVSTEPRDDVSCFDYSGGRPVPLTRGIQMHTPSPCGGLPTPALTCARWGVHLQDHVPDRGF